MTKPTFFASPSEFREWLEENHDQASELFLGFYKKDSGKKGITYSEALDEALRYGWIDGVRKSLGETRWMIRFTPRKPKSVWSLVNIKRFKELQAEGRIEAPGLAAFERRDPEKARKYAYEEAEQELDPEYESQLKRNQKAWQHFESQAPSYRRTIKHWIMRGKAEETRQRRLGQLIAASGKGKRLL
ncbi:MAG TPA: YdeI/OmpD-associated family protein [Thermoanaerobaculia bacterium]|nr:YdeI/OmpD-associated family protein [Thermoanaerobaculia bacterium]